MRLFIVMAGIAVLSIGCEGGGKSGGAGASGSSSPIIIRGTIGATGGIIESPSGDIRIEFPAGTLSNDTLITIEEVPTTGFIRGERIVKLSPDGINFAKPVSFTMTVADEHIQKYEIDLQNLSFFVELQNGEYEVVAPTRIDQGKKQITAEIRHFSKYVTLTAAFFLSKKQPFALFDETPVPYEILTVITPTGNIIPIPVIVHGASNANIVLGKGKLADAWKPGKRVLFVIHGLTASPLTFFYNEQAQLNRNDFGWLLLNDPAFNTLFDVIIYVMYPSAHTVEEVASWLIGIIRKNVQPGASAFVLPHSLGCPIVRQIFEKEGNSYFTKTFFLGGPHEGGELSRMMTYFTHIPVGNLVTKGLLPSGEQVTVGSSFLTDSRTGLNPNFPGKRPPTADYHLIAGTLIDSNGNPLGHDGLVEVSSAKPAFLGVPPAHTLVVRDGHWEIHGNAKKNGVAIKFREWVTGQPNRTPAANAGVDQTITLGSPATLDGSGSRDPDLDALTYAWTQTGGPNVTLANANTAIANFTPTQAGVYTFQLTVSDTVATGTDTVTITVIAPPPPPIQKRTFHPTFDTDDLWQNPTMPALTVGGSGSGRSYTTTIEFGGVTKAIPPGTTIKSATLTLIERGNWRSGTIQVTGGNAPTQTAPSSYIFIIDVTAYVQSAIASGQTCTFSITSTSAYVEYYSSESFGWEPTVVTER